MKDFISRISSRKFLFFLAATGFFIFDKMSSTEWIYCGIIFIGGKTFEKAIDAYKAIKTMSNKDLAQEIKD